MDDALTLTVAVWQSVKVAPGCQKLQMTS